MVLASIGVSSIAHAEPSAVDKATAQTLFDDGKTLVEQGKYAEACPKLAESNRLDAGLGTMLRLADCYEKNGQSASAWATFLDAADVAKKAADSREKVARERADALASKVSKLEVRVAAPVPGLEVRRDGELLGAALWGTAAPVDPGKHVVEASAPGYRRTSREIEVPSGGGTSTLTIDELAKESGPPSPASSPKPPSSPAPQATSASASDRAETGSSQRTASYVVGGAGVVALAAGIVVYLGAASKHTDAVALCNPWCNDDAKAANDAAKSRGTLGGIALGVGAALIATGGVLYLTSPRSETSALRVAPEIGRGSGGVSLGGAF